MCGAPGNRAAQMAPTLTLTPRTGEGIGGFLREGGAGGLVSDCVVDQRRDFAGGFRDWNAAAMNVGDDGAVGLDGFERGPVNHVGAQALGGDEAGALAHDHADDVGAPNLAEMDLDSDPRVADGDWLQGPWA